MSHNYSFSLCWRYFDHWQQFNLYYYLHSTIATLVCYKGSWCFTTFSWCWSKFLFQCFTPLSIKMYHGSSYSYQYNKCLTLHISHGSQRITLHAWWWPPSKIHISIEVLLRLYNMPQLLDSTYLLPLTRSLNSCTIHAPHIGQQLN